MGAQLVREVASKTSDIAGDGTTTATVLAESIYKEGLRNVTAGANPTSLQRGLMKAVEAVVELAPESALVVSELVLESEEAVLSDAAAVVSVAAEVSEDVLLPVTVIGATSPRAPAVSSPPMMSATAPTMNRFGPRLRLRSSRVAADPATPPPDLPYCRSPAGIGRADTIPRNKHHAPSSKLH